MNKNMICCKCKQRPAVIFVTKMEGEKTTNEGYCIKCAMEMNIGPIKQMMDNMGITEEQSEGASEVMSGIMDYVFDFKVVESTPYDFYDGLGLIQ